MTHINEQRLLTMLTYCRPAYTLKDEEFIAKFIDVVEGMQDDEWGNRWLIVGGAQPTTMFSCHTDTVHKSSGEQKILFDPQSGDVFLPDKSSSNCLGADDGAGVEVMLSLIEAGVEGLYVFHRAEEKGGDGSEFFASADPSGVLDGVKHCVAFDRKGFNSIITHQMTGRCCSDEFANALAKQLKRGWPSGKHMWRRDDTGSFTDSANYVDRIPECTNLSVGYDRQHTTMEVQNVTFLDQLVASLKQVKWSELPAVRNPEDDSEWDSYSNYGMGNSWGDKYKYDDYAEWASQDTVLPYDTEFTDWQHAYDYACRHPEHAADLLYRAYGMQPTKAKPRRK